MKPKNKKPIYQKGKIIIAMSGGIDSSVAAALLKEQGYNVIGVFMDMHKNFDSSNAKKIAKKLNIPLKILNLKREFKKRVIDYFIKEYKEGRTPNPCVICNKWIKFRFLVEKASELNADYIATGHYAKVKNGELFIAKDIKKDQSYFLWTLKQNQLKKILFPIGDYTKNEVRKIAEKRNLFIHKNKESQEICFVPDADLRRFLKSRIHAEKGPIVMNDGKKVGEHEGLAFYTIGQRKGIKIGGIGPLYVVQKDLKNNTLVVAKSENISELYKKEIIVEKVSWISGKKLNLPIKCKIKIRYLHPANLAIIKQKANNKLQIVFNKKQKAATPGQSAVFYKQSKILGGGVII